MGIRVCIESRLYTIDSRYFSVHRASRSIDSCFGPLHSKIGHRSLWTGRYHVDCHSHRVYMYGRPPLKGGTGKGFQVLLSYVIYNKLRYKSNVTRTRSREREVGIFDSLFSKAVYTCISSKHRPLTHIPTIPLNASNSLSIPRLFSRGFISSYRLREGRGTGG